MPNQKGTLWEQVIPDAQSEAVDLVRNILLYNSSKRLTANEVKKIEGKNIFSNLPQSEQVFYSFSSPPPGSSSRILLLRTFSLYGHGID